jgi:hypothetical protein
MKLPNKIPATTNRYPLILGLGDVITYLFRFFSIRITLTSAVWISKDLDLPQRQDYMLSITARWVKIPRFLIYSLGCQCMPVLLPHPVFLSQRKREVEPSQWRGDPLLLLTEGEDARVR